MTTLKQLFLDTKLVIYTALMMSLEQYNVTIFSHYDMAPVVNLLNYLHVLPVSEMVSG